jgi:putative membrane protein
LRVAERSERERERAHRSLHESHALEACIVSASVVLHFVAAPGLSRRERMERRLHSVEGEEVSMPRIRIRPCATLALLATTALGACEKAGESVAVHYPAATPTGDTPAAQAIAALPEPDRQFVQQATGANLAAIRLGQLAMERGSTDRIRKLGRELVNAHTLLNDHLLETARVEGRIPLASARLTPAEEDAYARLLQLSGPAFDQALLQAVTAQQQRTLDSFNREAIDGRDDRIRAFADDVLPLLHDHARYVRTEIEIM